MKFCGIRDSIGIVDEEEILEKIAEATILYKPIGSVLGKHGGRRASAVHAFKTATGCDRVPHLKVTQYGFLASSGQLEAKIAMDGNSVISLLTERLLYGYRTYFLVYQSGCKITVWFRCKKYVGTVKDGRAVWEKSS